MMDWDERYSQEGFTYGRDPNDFLVSVADRIPRGKILSLAEGEGRNAVYLASLGCRVTGVDGSEVGLSKARGLALQRGVAITTIAADLSGFAVGEGEWDGITAFYCHLPSELRIAVHRAVVQGLKPGGVFVLEAFSKEQLCRETGGPKSLDMLMSLDELKLELAGLEFLHAVQLERAVREGSHHTGLASVVQILAVKR